MPEERKSPAFRAGFKFGRSTDADRLRKLLDDLIEPKNQFAEKATDYAIGVVVDQVDGQVDDLIDGIVAGRESRP